ncbi:hypothetical protein KKG41_00455 [Patescibacteria group bacterium]|nr:hypothetical protein [Patescibacteria group bacterium]MBU1890895.1 hypothetical protein [Patescibacteria group bacterium]
MIRRNKYQACKLVISALILIILPLNSTEAFLGDFFYRMVDDVDKITDNTLALADNSMVPSETEEGTIEEEPIIEEGFVNPLDYKGDEIINETCEVNHTPSGKTHMRCSKSKRFEKIGGDWKDFNEIVSGELVDGQIKFTYKGKSFRLKPFVIQNSLKKNIADLPNFEAEKINYLTNVDSKRRYIKWTNTFSNDKSITQAGYSVMTDLPIDFKVQKNNGIIEHLSLIVDNYIEVSFDDLINSGYTLERDGRNIIVSGIPDGKVELDPELFFYSTSAVDGYIIYCSGDAENYDIYAGQTTSYIGENRQNVCAGGSVRDMRSYLSFDTSDLDDDITIDSADIITYAHGYDNYHCSVTYDVDYYIGTDDIGASLTDGDWGNVGSYNSQLTWGGTTGWKTRSISSPDSNVSKTGDTDFELRDAWSCTSGYQAKAQMRQTEYSGVTSDPYLQVVWGNDYWGNQFVTDSISGIGNLTGNTLKAGIKFTAQNGGQLDAFRVNIYTRATPPTYRFGIQSDSSGDPSGTWLAGTGGDSYVDISPASTGWQTVTFTTSPDDRPTLVAGTVYHIVVEYQTGTIGLSNYIGLLRLDPRNQLIPYRMADDTAADTEFYNGASWSAQDEQPVYYLDYATATDEGAAYINAIQGTVYKSGSTYVAKSERFTVYGNSKQVDSVGVYVKKSTAGTPSADLLYEIIDSSDTSLDSGTLVTAASASTSLTWETASLSSSVDLDAGETYRILVYSDTTTSCYYKVGLDYNTNSSPYNDISYNGTDSVYGYCSDTDCTVNANYNHANYYDMSFRFTVEKIFSPRQQNWRMYGDEDDATPGDAYADENTTPPDKIGLKEPIKLRMTIADVGDLAEDNIRFALYWSTSSTFSDGGTIVSETGCTTETWCYYNGDNVSDDGTIASTVLSDASTVGRHNESGTSSSTFDFTASDEVEFEFTIWSNNATANTTYYFSAYDTVNDVLVPLNPSGDYSYPVATTTASYSLIADAPATAAFTSYTLGGAGTNTRALEESADEEINTWDDRGTGVGWSVTAVMEHMRNQTTGTPWSNLTSDVIPMSHIRNTVRTNSNNIVYAYNDVTDVEFITSSDFGATWSEAISGSPTTVGDGTSVPSIYIDSNEDIHLCYEEDEDIDYRKLTKSGSQWTIGSASEVVAGGEVEGYDFYECSIIVESDGDIMVAVWGQSWADGSNVTGVYRDTGGGFSLSRSIEDDSDDPSLVLWNSDNVALFYIDEGSGFYWDNFNGSSWAGGAEVDADEPDNQFSVTSDSSNVLHVAYKDANLEYRSYDGSWSGETTVNIGSNDGRPVITTDDTSVWIFFNHLISTSRYLSYYEYDGSAWDSSPTTPLAAEQGILRLQTVPNINRNQFFVIYQTRGSASDYDGFSYFNKDLIRAEDIDWSTDDVVGLYGAELGSCPSAGVCAGAGGAMDPDSSITIVDADACTSGCPADPSYGMGKYYCDATITLSDLNNRLTGDYVGTMTITIA